MLIILKAKKLKQIKCLATSDIKWKKKQNTKVIKKRTTKRLYERLNYVGTNCVFNAYLTFFWYCNCWTQQHNDAKIVSNTILYANWIWIHLWLQQYVWKLHSNLKIKEKLSVDVLIDVLLNEYHGSLITTLFLPSFFLKLKMNALQYAFFQWINFLKINICSLHMLIWLPIFFFFQNFVSLLNDVYTE